MEASSSSSQVMPAGPLEGRSGRRRVSGVDEGEALWRRAFDPDTLNPLAEYANRSIFEDPSNRRSVSDKFNWWGLYLAERKVRRLYVSDEILVGLRENLSEGISRLRWLIDFGYSSAMVPDKRREKPKSKC